MRSYCVEAQLDRCSHRSQTGKKTDLRKAMTRQEAETHSLATVAVWRKWPSGCFSTFPETRDTHWRSLEHGPSKEKQRAEMKGDRLRESS